MAKSQFYPEATINLVTNGRNLPEYDDDDDEGGQAETTTKYVEVETGSTFSIRVMLHCTRWIRQAEDRVEAAVYLDGKRVHGSVVEPPHNDRDTTFDIPGVRSFENGAYQLERFAFTELRTTDEAARPSLKEELKGLGEVTIKLHIVRASAQRSTRRIVGCQGIGVGGVPEKALKGRAISNQTTLAPPEATNSVTMVSVEYPYGKLPFATHTFKYRSRSKYWDLQSEMIIPRSPSPLPLEERDADTLTLEESRQLNRILRERTENSVNIKCEKRDATHLEEDEDANKGHRNSSRPRKQYRTSRHLDSGVEIIELDD